jgi:hypothetical protein
MIKNISGLPKNVLGFEVSGVVSAEDYETVIIPAVDVADTGLKNLRMLYYITPEFEKFDFGAMWDDTKVGLQHLTSWEKVAVVTDIGWVRSAIKVFGFAIPGHFRVFEGVKLSEAKHWLAV